MGLTTGCGAIRAQGLEPPGDNSTGFRVARMETMTSTQLFLQVLGVETQRDTLALLPLQPSPVLTPHTTQVPEDNAA